MVIMKLAWRWEDSMRNGIRLAITLVAISASVPATAEPAKDGTYVCIVDKSAGLDFVGPGYKPVEIEPRSVERFFLKLEAQITPSFCEGQLKRLLTMDGAEVNQFKYSCLAKRRITSKTYPNAYIATTPDAVLFTSPSGGEVMFFWSTGAFLRYGRGLGSTSTVDSGRCEIASPTG